MRNAVLQAGLCLLLAIAATAIVGARFAPRVAYWRALTTTGIARQNPETHRAVDALAQLHDPSTPPQHELHQVLAWRLLFPWAGHYLRLSDGLYLALPHAGCLLALWLAAGLARGWGIDRWNTLLVALLSATLPWFFVSMGWLAYFDSWLFAALLILAFVERRWAVAAACLAAPWIDERFMLALPLTILVRALALRWDLPERRGEARRDLLVIVAASIPYPAARAIALLAGEEASAGYVSQHLDQLRAVGGSRFVAGIWSGFRAAWVFVLAAAWFVARRQGRWWGVALAVATAVATAGGLVIAADISRSMTILAPVMLLGIVAWFGAAPRSFRLVLPLVVAANLLLPAAHVVWTFTVPLHSGLTALEEYRHPPLLLRAETYTSRARAALRANRPAAALEYYEAAVRLDPRCTDALVGRASIRWRAGDRAGAGADVARALELAPRLPDALLLRAAMHMEAKDRQGAAADLRAALDAAPAEWENRPAAETMLRQADGGPAP